jgi:hypothetical protein
MLAGIHDGIHALLNFVELHQQLLFIYNQHKLCSFDRKQTYDTASWCVYLVDDVLCKVCLLGDFLGRVLQEHGRCPQPPVLGQLGHFRRHLLCDGGLVLDGLRHYLRRVFSPYPPHLMASAQS